MHSAPTTILFDLGETLFEPLPTEFSEHNLLYYARRAGVKTSDKQVVTTFRQTKALVAKQFAEQIFYKHREFIRTAFLVCCDTLGYCTSTEIADKYVLAQREAVMTHLRPREDCFSTLQELRARNYRLGIVSNIDNDWLDPLLTRWQLAARVDGILSSESARSCKPDPRIFTLACELMQRDASETWFVGDDELNDIRGSKQAGMTPVLFKPSGQRRGRSAAAHVIHELKAVLSLV